MITAIAEFRHWCHKNGINPDDVKVTIEFPTRGAKTAAADAIRVSLGKMLCGVSTWDQKEFESGINKIMGIQFNLTIAKCPTCKREQ